jgi:hypothetical protein
VRKTGLFAVAAAALILAGIGGWGASNSQAARVATATSIGINPFLVVAVPTLPQKTLKVVPAPLVKTVPTAPPVLELPNPTVEFQMWKVRCRLDASGRE